MTDQTTLDAMITDAEADLEAVKGSPRTTAWP